MDTHERANNPDGAQSSQHRKGEVRASHPMRRQFRAAMAPGTATTGTRGFAGSLFARTPAQVGTDPAPALGEVAGPGTPSPRLPHPGLDDGADRGVDRARV